MIKTAILPVNSLEKYQTSVVVIRIAIPKKSILFRYLFGKLGLKFLNCAA